MRILWKMIFEWRNLRFKDGEHELRFVATDAHKLVKFETKEYTANEVSEFIMPKKPLQILKGILQSDNSELTIQHNNSNAKFIFDKSTCSKQKQIIEYMKKWHNEENVLGRTHYFL